MEASESSREYQKEADDSLTHEPSIGKLKRQGQSIGENRDRALLESSANCASRDHPKHMRKGNWKRKRKIPAPLTTETIQSNYRIVYTLSAVHYMVDG